MFSKFLVAFLLTISCAQAAYSPSGYGSTVGGSANQMQCPPGESCFMIHAEGTFTDTASRVFGFRVMSSDGGSGVYAYVPTGTASWACPFYDTQSNVSSLGLLFGAADADVADNSQLSGLVNPVYFNSAGGGAGITYPDQPAANFTVGTRVNKMYVFKPNRRPFVVPQTGVWTGGAVLKIDMWCMVNQ